MEDYDAVAQPRNTYDECVTYITNELVLAAQALPLDRAIQEIARPTVVRSISSSCQSSAIAASPLMTGQTPADIASELVDDQVIDCYQKLTMNLSGRKLLPLPGM